MLVDIDPIFTQGDYILFENKGKAGPHLKTNKYVLTNRKTGVIIGYVRWMKLCISSLQCCI